jgi:hypothetical protein
MVSNEIMRGGLPPIEIDSLLGNDTPEIIAMFRRRLFGLRRLPRRERQAAIRAAREWLMLALKGLREKRERERRARSITVRQLKMQLRPKPD